MQIRDNHIPITNLKPISTCNELLVKTKNTDGEDSLLKKRLFPDSQSKITLLMEVLNRPNLRQM